MSENENDVEETPIVEFVPLRDHDDYEILTVFPFTIRRKDNHYEVSEFDDGQGYIQVKLNNKTYRKHRLIALQFLPNTYNLPHIDHKNRNRSDYHIENLRFVSSSMNHKNRTSYNNNQCEYVDELPDDAIFVDLYGNYQFKNYYYSNDMFYFFNGIKYRKLKVCEDKRGLLYVNARDVDNRRVNIYYSKFKREHDLM